MVDEISTQEIRDLARRVDKENPTTEDIEELRSLLRDDPNLWRRGGDLANQNQKKLINEFETK